jgi:hypothetical protein
MTECPDLECVTIPADAITRGVRSGAALEAGLILHVLRQFTSARRRAKGIEITAPSRSSGGDAGAARPQRGNAIADSRSDQMAACHVVHSSRPTRLFTLR